MAKKPTLKEKKLLTTLGFDYADWLVSKRHSDWIEVLHRCTGEKKMLWKATTLG